MTSLEQLHDLLFPTSSAAALSLGGGGGGDASVIYRQLDRIDGASGVVTGRDFQRWLESSRFERTLEQTVNSNQVCHWWVDVFGAVDEEVNYITFEHMLWLPFNGRIGKKMFAYFGRYYFSF